MAQDSTSMFKMDILSKYEFGKPYKLIKGQNSHNCINAVALRQLNNFLT